MTTRQRPILIVSIHAVSPVYREELFEIFRQLDRRHIAPRNLLLVPSLQRDHPLDGDANFLALLHRLHDAGDEAAQHGFDHRYVEQRAHALRARIIGDYVSGGRAEFVSAGYMEARQRIQAGQRILRRAGFVCSGFAAPGWRLTRMGRKAVQDAGFRYVVGVRAIDELQSRRRRPIPTAFFAPHLPWLDSLLRLRARYLAHSRQRYPVLGLAIHPQDVYGTTPFAVALAFLDAVAPGRDCVSYAAFLRRSAAHPESFHPRS